MTEQALYRVVLRGGRPFSIEFPSNPAIAHDGSMTVENLVLSETEANQLRGLALVSGCSETTVERTPGQTEEQRIFREALLGLHPVGGDVGLLEGFTSIDTENNVSTLAYDAVVNLETPKGKVTVNLARGGEQFPWAAHNGRVITGPPDGTLTSDGTPLSSLEWKTNSYWVVDAVDEKGDDFQLTPEQYEEAVTTAEKQRGRRRAG